MCWIIALISMPFTAIWWTIVSFFSGIVFPWEDDRMSEREISYIISILGGLMGSICYSVIFAVAGFCYGLYYPFEKAYESKTKRKD